MSEHAEGYDVVLESPVTHSEAPVVIWTTIVHPRGLEFNVTVRGNTLEEVHGSLAEYASQKIQAGWIPVTSRGEDALRKHRNDTRKKAAAEAADVVPDDEQPEEGAPKAPQAPPAKPAPQKAATAEPTTQAAGDGKAKSGTAPLESIKVDADGRVEFYVKGFKWPFKDARGAERVSALFDEDLGWDPEHLYPGAKYESECVGLWVDWEKPGKYYNVLLVHA
jgi:hypothetical protein